MLKHEAPDGTVWRGLSFHSTPACGKTRDKWLGAAWIMLGIWHCIPSRSITPQHRDGGKRQHVPDSASTGSSCSSQPKLTSLARCFQQCR